MTRVLILIVLALLAQPAAAQGPFASFDRASEAVLNDPHDLTMGPDGRLYIADKFGNRIVVMDPDTLEVLETIGDGQLVGIHDVSFGPDGTLFAAVTGANAVAAFVFVDGKADFAYARGPFPRTEGALAHSNGRLYAMASGTGQLIAMEGEDALFATSGMPGAHDVAEAPDGTIWVADTGGRRLMQFDQDLGFLKSLDGPVYGFIGPRYMAFDDFGRLIVADQDAHRILQIDPASGALLGILGDGSPGEGPGKFDDPEGVATYGGAYFISDSDNNRIVRYVVVVN